ncbi:GntR family transcriptional regulator [Paracoccus sp. (in: a-proteobacteria)]|uniref:GntR family transcriptional regulator n=1 Tax=Paracoccus sp. TaxID=267 RepID=UPI003A89FAD4
MAIELSAAERAYRTIRRKIVSLELAPNTAVGELQLADMLGVSRTPIREALTRLSSEGLVDFRSRAGTTVAPIRLDAVRAAQFVREKLEVAIVREAAAESSRRFKFSVQQAVEEQKFAITDGDTALFFASDERMHQSFAEMAGRPAVWPVISEAKKHMDRLRWLSLATVSAYDLNTLLDDHVELFNAIAAHDSDRAQVVMELHLRRVMAQIDQLVAAQPDYFETIPIEQETE